VILNNIYVTTYNMKKLTYHSGKKASEGDKIKY